MMTIATGQDDLQVEQEAGLRPAPGGVATAHWHVLWTRSHCEWLVQEQVEAKGYASVLPTRDLEGLFPRGKPAKGLLVLSVELLQRSVAVEVDATEVAPA